MKNRTKLPNIYIGVVTAVLYLPIVLVIIYSFNESKISSARRSSARWVLTASPRCSFAPKVPWNMCPCFPS